MNQNKMETVTLERLNMFASINNAINWAKAQVGVYPKRPSKPFLKRDATSTEAEQYAKDLKAYEQSKPTFDQQLTDWRQKENEINKVIKEYICQQSGLNSIPEKYHKKIWDMAWDRGHSNGYYEVYLELEDLVNIFE